MFWNYLKVSLRNNRKNKIFSFINIFGLAAAMTICLLILLMLADQKDYDAFNVHKDKIYRILTNGPDFRNPYATGPFPLAEELAREDPDIDAATHLIRAVGGDAVFEQHSAEMRGYFADSSFFSIFSFALQQGNRQTALNGPNALVITADLSRRLFGTESSIGKTVQFNDRGLNYLDQGESSSAVPWGLFTITGVLADIPYKSHLPFEALMSSASIPSLIQSKKIPDSRLDWTNFYTAYTYVLIKPAKNLTDLNRNLAHLSATHYAAIKDYKGIYLSGQPLTSISPGVLLGNEPRISLTRSVYYFLGILALVIMISAGFNYTNLSVARALTRAKEIGIRKVNGATRKNLIVQFLSESVLTSISALVLSLLFLVLVKSAFVHLWVNQYLHFELEGNTLLYGIFLMFAVTIGIFAGLYPAVYLSGFEPAKTLRSSSNHSPGRLPVRKLLSVFQFVISLVFIISSLLIFKQSQYFLHFKYEFNSSNIINVELQSNDVTVARRALGGVPGVVDISSCDYIPVTGRSEGMPMKAERDTGSVKNVTALRIDDHFFSVLGLRLIAGKNLGSEKQSSRFVVVNEAAVKTLGYDNSRAIIGQALTNGADSPSTYIVTGVVQNFHMALDQDKIGPLVLLNQASQFKFLNIKIASVDMHKTIEGLRNQWRTIDPVHPIKYKFFDEQLAATSQGFFDVVTVLGFIAFLAVTIACLGMLGMAVHTTERRRKEIGIRKTLGAPTKDIALLLSREFLRVLLIAILIASPISYLVNNLWLQKFPNRVHFGLDTIATGILTVLCLGGITIGSQTLRAAKVKPVDAMKLTE